MTSIGTPLEWIGFGVIVFGMLALDLFVFNRKAHRISLKEAGLWSFVWIALALGFNLWIYFTNGSKPALHFLTAYLVEKSLSVDNLFVFIAIFAYFKIPAKDQHRVLFWGVIGALVMRVIFIAAGAALLTRFEWMMFIFGAFLIYTGIKLGFEKEKDIDPAQSPVMRLATRYMRTTPKLHGHRFFVRENGLLKATPLFLVLIFIEFSDVLFAVDSVPAVLGITTDIFVVYTSNIFAILGLRALFFLLAGALTRLVYLNVGLALVLIFIGVKMLIEEWWHVPVWMSLGVIASILTLTVLASLFATPESDEPSQLKDE